MSNSHNPWAQQDPRWQPQSYHDAQGRDPRQPFGAAPAGAGPGAAPPSVEQFSSPPPKGGNPLWMALGVVAVCAAVLVGVMFLGGEDPAAPSASPSASQSGPDPSALPSATGQGTSVPFEGAGTGTFEILRQEWTASGLEVRFRISMDADEESFIVYMFENKTMKVIDPDTTDEIRASKERPYEGTVRFSNVDRGPGTLVLANEWNRAITALPVKG